MNAFADAAQSSSRTEVAALVRFQKATLALDTSNLGFSASARNELVRTWWAEGAGLAAIRIHDEAAARMETLLASVPRIGSAVAIHHNLLVEIVRLTLPPPHQAAVDVDALRRWGWLPNVDHFSPQSLHRNLSPLVHWILHSHEDAARDAMTAHVRHLRFAP